MNSENKQQKVLKILIEARRKIADRNNWIRGQDAVNNYGAYVHSTYPSAVRFCASGAIKHAIAVETYPNHYYDNSGLEIVVRDVVDEIAKKHYKRSIIGVNDHNIKRVAHARVLRVFDEAIERTNERI